MRTKRAKRLISLLLALTLVLPARALEPPEDGTEEDPGLSGLISQVLEEAGDPEDETDGLSDADGADPYALGPVQYPEPELLAPAPQAEIGDPVEPENFLAGSGTAEDPFLIATVGQFVKMAQEYCPDSSPKTGVHFLQIADLDLGGLPESCYPCALGASSVYDGGGFTISNPAFGLFAALHSIQAVIQNVHVENCNITTPRGNYTGGIVGLNNGTIRNCSISGMICGSQAGGIVGCSEDYGVIESCVNMADVQGGTYAGGIVYLNKEYYGSYGPHSGLVQNCYNVGHIVVAGGDGAVTPGYGIASGFSGAISPNVAASGIVKNCYDNDTLARETDPRYRLAYVQSDTDLVNSYYLCGGVKEDKWAVTEAEFQGEAGVSMLDPNGTGAWEEDTYNINGGLPVLAWENELAARDDAGPCTVIPSVPSGGDPILEPFSLTLSGGKGTIWYTTDGSDPQVSSTRIKYEGSIPIPSGSTLLRVWSEGEGFGAILRYQVVRHPVTPSLPDGVYTGAQIIQLTCADGGTIYYTTDGSDPRTSTTRTLYAGSVTLDRSSVTLRAAAQVSREWGDPLTYTYTLIPDVILAPAPGTYEQPTYVSLSTSLTDCRLYYSTDGSDPYTQGALYDGSPILLLGPTDLKVSRWTGNNGYSPETYHYGLPETVITPSREPGAQDGVFQLSFSYTGLPGLQLYVSRDGGAYQPYTGPLDVYKDASFTVQARYDGAVAAEEAFAYAVPAPVITPSRPAGTYNGVFPLTLDHNGGDGFQLYVSRDGGDYRLYDGPLDIYKSVNLSVQARWQDDPVTTSSFRYTLPAPVLTASPQEGTYTLSQEVALSCNIPGYSIAYALDGGEPVPYTGPVPIQQSASLTAFAQYKGETVAERTFAYALNLPELTASQDSGTKANPIDVALTCSQSGFQILYTLDGSDPREGGSVYSAPIHLDRPAELRAVPVTTVNGARRYGAEKRWQYAFEDLLTVKNLTVTPQAKGYELSATLDNRYPESRGAFLLAAGYDAAGRLTEAKLFPAASAANGTAALSGLFTPSRDLHHFRVLALEQGTWKPLAAPVLTSRVLTGLSVSPASITGKQGTSQSVTVTAQYSDGTTRVLGSGQYTAASSNSSAATLSGGSVYLAGGGSAVITVSYAEGGVTKTARISVSSQAKALTGISVSPASFSGTAGGSQFLSVTAQYSDGTTRVLSAGEYTAVSSNGSVASVSGGYVRFGSAGSAALTISYTEGGVTRTASAGVTVREAASTAIQRLVSFLRTQPKYEIKMTTYAGNGTAGTTNIRYDASQGDVHFQFSFFSSSGGGGAASFNINASTGSVNSPLSAIYSSSGSTLWSGIAYGFNPSTYYHGSTTLYFTRFSGVSTDSAQSFANTAFQILVKDAQTLLVNKGTGVTLGQLGFSRYA